MLPSDISIQYVTHAAKKNVRVNIFFEGFFKLGD